MKEVPGHEQLFVLMDANARTGRREGRGDLAMRIVEPLSPTAETRSNDNGERLLAFATNHCLALVKHVFQHPQESCVAYFQRARQKAHLTSSCTPGLAQTHLGPQHRRGPRETTRSIRTQPPDEERKKAAHRSATADYRSLPPRVSDEIDRGPFEGDPPKRQQR